jgi:EmrB/QacA subfamily drug resistance transporter
LRHSTKEGEGTGRIDGEMSQATLQMGTPQARWILFTTVLGSGLVMLDATVVNVALQRIGTELDASFADLQWTVNAYTLTLAALILLGGSLGDRFGRRRMFVIGVTWFAVASALCGIAPNVESLIAARGLQGVGGALLTPGSLAIISASFAGADRAAAVGAWSGLGGLAGAVGPFLGGWLVEISWRLVFLVNLPLAVLVVLVARRHVPETRNPTAPAQIDVSGALLAAAGLAALTYGLTAAGGPEVPTSALAAAVAGAAVLVAFVVVQRRSTHPLVPVTIFRSRQFVAANAVTVLVYAGLSVVFLLLVLQLQVVAGFSPLLSGAALLPVTAVMVALSSRAGALAQRIGPRIPMTAGPLVAAGGLLLLVRVGAGSTYLRDVLPAMTIFGLGLSLTVAPLTATVLAAAENRYAGVASGVNNAVARVAGLLALAAVPVLAGISGTDYADPGNFDPGFERGMVIAAALLAAGALTAFLLIRDVPAVEPVMTPAQSEHCLECLPDVVPGFSVSAGRGPPRTV